MLLSESSWTTSGLYSRPIIFSIVLDVLFPECNHILYTLKDSRGTLLEKVDVLQNYGLINMYLKVKHMIFCSFLCNNIF